MTPPHFNTYQSSYNNPQFQQQFPQPYPSKCSPSQSLNYGSIHPTQHYSSTYPSKPQFNNSYIPSSHLYQSHMNHKTLFVLQTTYQSPQAPIQPMTESPFVDSGLAIPVFSPGDDPIAYLNKAMAFLTAEASSSYSGNGYKGNATSSGGTNASGQTEDLDTYDSDCDDISNAKAVLMANISNYGSDVISEVPYSETYLNDMENQSVHAMQDFEQTPVVDFTDNVIHSNSNIILYSQYLQETQQATVQDTNLQAQQDSMILSVIEQMSEQMIIPLSAEQAFWFRMSNPTIESSDKPPVKVEVPSELLKVSLVNESFKKLKFHLAQFDSVVKKRTTPNARTEEYFEINYLKVQFQDKDTTICKLKEIIKSLRENNKEEIVNYDRCELQTINEELENSVAKLLLENERLCKEINHVK
ncbi:hypothetical protein Tco_0018666 [Tanacetum coccineum]